MKETGPRLSYALAAAYGVEVGRESTADALAYAWEPWNARKLRAGRPDWNGDPRFVSAPGAAHIAGYALPDFGETLGEREQNAGSRAFSGGGFAFVVE